MHRQLQALVRRRATRALPLNTVPEEGLEMAFTAVFKRVPEGYIAFVEELAGGVRRAARNPETRTSRKGVA